MVRLAWLVVLLVAGCRQGDAPPAPAPSGAVAPATGHLHALLVNGGGSKPQNFRSHLLHVEQMFGVLERAGVDRSRMAVFSADGDDPDPDVALRDDAEPADFWLIDGTRLESPLRPPIDYVDTRLDDMPVRAATKENLTAWFENEGRALKPGDVLLLYVTDHGSKNADDTANNRIVLWGKDESLSVQELASLLELLDPGVRVVMLMSQCYSGAFAGLAGASAGTDRPAGNVCGYFSSTADRQAYGCYAENRGRENIGHSFHFIEGLATTGRFATAHDDVLVADATPDVPLRTSDAYLEELLRRRAVAENRELADVVDDLLADAWRDRKAWEPDIRRLDRIAAAYGVFSPRSLHELDEQSQRIDGMVDQLKTHGRAWQNARESLARANLDRFVTSHAEWTERLADGALTGRPRTDLDALAGELLPAMAAAVAADDVTAERFATLRDKAEDAKEIGYRMDVRQGVVLRMRAILLSIAGRVDLATAGTPAERAEYEGLRRCEDLQLPASSLPAGTELVRAAPFPPLADDVELAKTVLPAWMGIQFRQAKDAVRTEHHLAEGAATVMMVYDDSPAQHAGLQEGDVVLGPPGAPFVEKDQIREWTMRRSPDVPASLEILRDGATRVVSLTPAAMPQKWPSLPGPPKVGSLAPPLRLVGYRGAVPTSLADGRRRLLFFWATWCSICKTAVPEVMAFGRARQTEVVAITDETATELDPFFAAWRDDFPAVVASDEHRSAFRTYGVGGTPSFVLVGADGTVEAQATGYAKSKGLQIDGWSWKGKDHAAPDIAAP